MELPAGSACQLAARLSARPGWLVPGYRPGKAGLRELLRAYRQRAEDAIVQAVQGQLPRELADLLEQSVLPPVYAFRRLTPRGSAEVEVQWFKQPQAPDPRARLGGLAAAPAGAEPQLPASAGADYQQLLPAAVRQLPQLASFRLGGAAGHGRTAAHRPAAPRIPDAGAGVAVDKVRPALPAQNPLTVRPASPAVDKPAAPRAGEVAA